MTSTDDDCDSHAKRLQRMKNDFLAAQERRRTRRLRPPFVNRHNAPWTAARHAAPQLSARIVAFERLP
jgi:hypothetical protein